MFLAILFLLVAIFSAVGAYTSFKGKNFFAVGFSLISVAVFGFFSIATLYSLIVHGTGAPL
ncbi:DUF2759 family protein [Shouchella shacheensis]|uniref:DUF2759 family protein n=1 Tax=Shouchella shacheensis TaxID=1649580 RepID=UPI00073FD69D|nr:DUF2759 family protein [Shouchella shacheensis]